MKTVTSGCSLLYVSCLKNKWFSVRTSLVYSFVEKKSAVIYSGNNIANYFKHDSPVM